MLLTDGDIGSGFNEGTDMTRIVMMRFVLTAAASTLIFSAHARAQNADINAIKGKIFDAKMMQQTFAGGLKHCNELDGTNFYFQARDRVLNLEDYHRSLDSLALQRVFNPETKRPWSQEDANARWEQVRKEANDDKANCALVASLPDLQKRLDELQQQAAAAPK
jgi:hypothetical protein